MKTRACVVAVMCLVSASGCRHQAPKLYAQESLTEQAELPRCVPATIPDSAAAARGVAGLAVRLSRPLLAGSGVPTRVRLVPDAAGRPPREDSLTTGLVVSFVNEVPGPYHVTVQRLGYRPQTVAAQLRMGYVDTVEVTLASAFP
jgi:hypothetical protein